MKVGGQIYAVTIQAIGHSTHNAALLFVGNAIIRNNIWRHSPVRPVHNMAHMTLFFGCGIENSGFIKGEHLSGFSSESALWRQNCQLVVGICYGKT
jgi:hypothetical protein